MTTTNTRGRQHRPTRADVADAWAHIRKAAAAGNLEACGLVIQFADTAHHDDENARRDLQKLGIKDSENGDLAEALAQILEAAPVLRELLDAK